MKHIAKFLRMLADRIDPPANVLTFKATPDASEFIAGIESIQRRLKAPCINGEIP